MQTAPCFIVWYSDAAAYAVNKWIDDLKRLADMRRLGSDVEETKQLIEQFLRPVFTPLWQQAAVAPLAFMDLGQAVAQATLVAYDEGLGTCLMSGPMMLDKVNKLLKLPLKAEIGRMKELREVDAIRSLVGEIDKKIGALEVER